MELHLCLLPGPQCAYGQDHRRGPAVHQCPEPADRGTGPADHVLRRGGSLPGADRDSRLGDVGGRPGAAGFRASEHGRGQH